jgi:hypothetical protein
LPFKKPSTYSLLPGYTTALVEGCIAVEYFDPPPTIQEKKYVFKCHRQTIDDINHIWPVYALAFHPTYNTFTSGSSSQGLKLWLPHQYSFVPIHLKLKQMGKNNKPMRY